MYAVLLPERWAVVALAVGRLGTGLFVAEPAQPYRSRNPRASPLFQLLETFYDQVKLHWEERCQSRYGFWRGLLDEAVARYLDCAVLERGFARVWCDDCRHTFLVGFSCKARGLCPSCAAKRGTELALFLEQEVLEPVSHSQWVFTLPKMLRPAFLHHRELLGELCRAAYDTVRELMQAAVAEQFELRPGFVAVVQTFTSDLRWSPHIHAIATRGAWTQHGDWVPLPHVDARAAELLFRHKVLRVLLREGRIDERRIELLLSWRHTGFSVDNSVTLQPDDRKGLHRLARYLLRAPVSLERLTWDEQKGEVYYAPRHGHDDAEDRSSYLQDRFDPIEFVARVLLHIPHPRLHSVRYFMPPSSAPRAVAKGHQRTPMTRPPSSNLTTRSH